MLKVRLILHLSVSDICTLDESGYPYITCQSQHKSLFDWSIVASVVAAVLIGLVEEWRTGLGLLEQTKDHPITVFAVFVILALASYAPIAR